MYVDKKDDGGRISDRLRYLATYHRKFFHRNNIDVVVKEV